MMINIILHILCWTVHDEEFKSFSRQRRSEREGWCDDAMQDWINMMITYRIWTARLLLFIVRHDGMEMFNDGIYRGWNEQRELECVTEKRREKENPIVIGTKKKRLKTISISSDFLSSLLHFTSTSLRFDSIQKSTEISSFYFFFFCRHGVDIIIIHHTHNQWVCTYVVHRLVLFVLWL